ncbi:unnamed protein product [Mucor hiemalis]
MKIPKSSILLLLLSTATTTTMAQEEYPCFLLSNSTTCPAYNGYYISLVGNAKRYPFLSNVTDMSSFDAGMQAYVKSPPFYMFPTGCATNLDASKPIPYARYSLSYLCASIIQDSLYSLPCNYQNNLLPKPLCQSTCYGWTTDVDTLTNDTSMCPNQVDKENTIEYLKSTCQYWSGLNATSYCVLGAVNEPNACGFEDKSRACTYCKSNGQDICCQNVSGCMTALSVGAIIGIIIGCLVFAGVIGALVYYFCYKKKNQRTKDGVSYSNNGISNYGFIMKTKVETNHDSTSALGYESLASQGALVPHPPHEREEQRYNNNKPPQLSIQNNTTPLAPLPPSQQPQGIGQPTDFSTTQTLEEFYEVKHPYPPQMGDELGLHVGDIVCVAMNFDDGWALGFNVTTGLKGVFPIVCVTPAPEELLEQLLYTDQPTNKILVEDGSLEHMNMQQICENLRRSMSASSRRTINTLPTSELTQHKNIPRRTASIMRSTYDYRESDSPTSPTLHTPFFDVDIMHQNNQSTNNNTLSQPEPALFQPIETFEMHRKNNRVSKLEE